MTDYLKFIARLEIVVYVIYLLLLIFGQFNLPFGLKSFEFISFSLVTLSFITTEVILNSIIEVRDAVFGNSELNLKSIVQSDRTPKGTTNILEKGGTLIEQNSQTKKWICLCGFHNPTSSMECLFCSKSRS